MPQRVYRFRTRNSGANLFLDAIDGFDIACRDASASAIAPGDPVYHTLNG